MKKSFGILAVAAAAVIGIKYALSGKKLQNLSFEPRGIRYVKQAGLWANLTSQKFALDLAIINPNNSASKFQEFVGNVLFNGKAVSSINIKQALNLPGNDTTILKGIKFNVSTSALATKLKDIANKNTSTITFQVKGNLKADGFTYPIDEKQTTKIDSLL